MTTAWLSIVGIGEDGLPGVPAAGRALIDRAEVLIGGARHLAMIPEDHPAERLTWRSPLKDTVADIAARKGRAVCVLATGDPMSYGIGVTLGREFGPQALTVLPAPGAFSLAAARMGWPLEDVTRLTLHGRSLHRLALHLQPDARLLILSENGETPAQVADLLTRHGFGGSTMAVLSHMGGPKETQLDGIAAGWKPTPCPDLNTIAVSCALDPGATPLYCGPGLPDDAFQHDGQLTKREIRAATLAKLMPRPGAMLWDIGAGCGSVAVEWMRMGGLALAVEREDARCRMILDNAASLGVPDLKLIQGSVPEVLADLPGTPDAIFLGGALSQEGLAEALWQRLSPGGVFVANAVILESEAVLSRLYENWGGELTRLSVSRLESVGPYHGWKPLMPVTQYSVRKQSS